MKLAFTRKKNELGDVWSYTFTPLEPLAWAAGQSVRLEVMGPYGPIEHRFSIFSAPATGEVTITTRHSGSPYKNALAALRPGDTVDAYGVEGDFIWFDTAGPHVFVAGGIGITPFIAMLSERAHHKLPMPAHLIYVNRDETIAFKQLLDSWALLHPEFTVSYKIGERASAKDIIVNGGLIYISGPSAMVTSLTADIISAGIDPSLIKGDLFTGRLPKDNSL